MNSVLSLRCIFFRPVAFSLKKRRCNEGNDPFRYYTISHKSSGDGNEGNVVLHNVVVRHGVKKIMQMN